MKASTFEEYIDKHYGSRVAMAKAMGISKQALNDRLKKSVIVDGDRYSFRETLPPLKGEK